ncbi:GNAT family N-acetyltransferase [Vallitalea guaymasensis]|uniref:GNAT family N-acetyltransferase n=1 Tax=Vallitalea guaymasensis TaxID=1185412 RepID=A0A8J8M7I8_9FIRM|nr:GNAT family N-acetyltransferase [Vallitalea guaymasensis]QUH27658.1 GNAT family N-acetyltransferase [Vallitalea guaymasensis]
MQEVKLVEPSILYRDSFLEFIEDVKETGYESYELYTKAEEDFNEFIKDLLDSSKGINIPEGWIPCSSFWLVDDVGEVIGVIRIRHSVDSEFLQMIGHIGYEIKSTHRNKGYGSKLLELGLVEARKLGLEEVIITCNENNIGSRKIIEKFKGKYIKSIFDTDDQRNLLQYKI